MTELDLKTKNVWVENKDHDPNMDLKNIGFKLFDADQVHTVRLLDVYPRICALTLTKTHTTDQVIKTNSLFLKNTNPRIFAHNVRLRYRVEKSEKNFLQTLFSRVEFCDRWYIVESFDNRLNLFLLKLEAIERLQWYANVFALLRHATFDKYVADRILSHIAIHDAPLNVVLLNHTLRPCATFVELFHDVCDYIDVPLKSTLTSDVPYFPDVETGYGIYVRNVAPLDLQLLWDTTTIVPSTNDFFYHVDERFIWCRESVEIGRGNRSMTFALRAMLQFHTFVLMSIEAKKEETRLFSSAMLRQDGRNQPKMHTFEDCFIGKVGNTHWFLIADGAVESVKDVLLCPNKDARFYAEETRSDPLLIRNIIVAHNLAQTPLDTFVHNGSGYDRDVRVQLYDVELHGDSYATFYTRRQCSHIVHGNSSSVAC